MISDFIGIVSEREKKIDSEIIEWIKKFHPSLISSSKMRKSEIVRRKGMRCLKNYALLECACKPSPLSEACGYYLIVKRGQQTVKCPKCKRRFWLAGKKIIATSDHVWELKGMIDHFRSLISLRRPPILYKKYSHIRKMLKKIHISCSPHILGKPRPSRGAERPVVPLQYADGSGSGSAAAKLDPDLIGKKDPCKTGIA